MLIHFQKNIRRNPDTGIIIAVEAGSKYEIDPDIISQLNDFLKVNPASLIADWHRQLNDNDIKKS